MKEFKEGQLYTKDEAAEILGVHPRTVYRWLMAGKLEGARLAKAWRISAEDIKAFYDRAKNETVAHINRPEYKYRGK